MSVWEKVQEQALGFIEKSNFKQCYQLIDQHKARYPKAAYPQILESYTKYKQSPLKFDYEAVLGSTYGPSGKLYTIDQDTLALLHRFFFELGKFEEALSVYERANSRQPSFELSYTWFDQALKDGNFKQMGKAALQLTKFPKDSVQESREYLFWNAISTVALIRFQGYRVSEQEKQILPLLTYKNLCGAKPFKNTQEVIVFCTVCEELFPNNAEKSLEIFNEVLPHLQTSVDLYLKNFFLKHATRENHQVVFDNCTKMLKSLDDYELMKRLVESGKELGKVKSELCDLIDAQVGPKSRNARLIRFEIDLAYDSKISDSSVEYYLERFHNRPCCAVDMARYRDRMDESVLESAFATFDVPADLIHDSNALKLKLGSRDTASNYYSKHESTLNSKPATDYSQCATFILDLAKETLMGSPNLEQAIYALSLLENYQRKDPHNYETMVWLIAMYVHLGLTPLAHSYYNDLKVKNVQVDSMDFLMYSRYSTLLPDKSHDYLNRTLLEHNALYDVSLGRVSQFINISFDRKSYSKILGMLEFQDRLLKSVGRWSKICESLNLTYVCNDKRAALLERVRADIARCDSTGDLTLSDNRDWSIFGYAEEFDKHNLTDTLATLNTGKEWILLNLAKAFMLEAVPTGTKSDLAERLLGMLPEGYKPETYLSSCELQSYNIITDLYNNNGNSLATLVSDLNTAAPTEGSWQTVHAYLTNLATLKTLDNLKKIKDKQQKQLIKQKLTALREQCDDRFADYKKQITAACSSLQAGLLHDQLSALGYAPLGPESLTSSLLEVQKSVRNL